MIVEILLATFIIETAKAASWCYGDYQQKNEKLESLSRHLKDSKTWGDLISKGEQFHKNHPELYIPVPKPVLIKAVHYLYPNLK